jgi:hypothetical protein
MADATMPALYNTTSFTSADPSFAKRTLLVLSVVSCPTHQDTRNIFLQPKRVHARLSRMHPPPYAVVTCKGALSRISQRIHELAHDLGSCATSWDAVCVDRLSIYCKDAQSLSATQRVAGWSPARAEPARPYIDMEVAGVDCRHPNEIYS